MENIDTTSPITLTPASQKRKILIKVFKWLFVLCISLFITISSGLYFFHDRICQLVLKEVNHELIEPIQVSEVDLVFWGSFPNLSIDLKDVYIQDRFSKSNSKDTLLQAKNIRLQFNPIDLWNEKYNIKYLEVTSGLLSLKTNEKGEANYDILKPSKTSNKKSFELNLKRICAKNVRLVYHNAVTNQHYKSTINNSTFSGNFNADNYKLKAECDMLINQLKSSQIVLLANKKASFVIDILVDNKNGSVKLPNAQINIEGLPFLLDGNITRDSLSLSVHSKDISLTDLVNKLSLDQKKEVEKYEGDGAVYFDLAINGAMDAVTPMKVNCQFGVKKGTLTEPVNNMKATDITLAGNYSNEGEAEDEYLKLERLNFKTAGGPFSGDLIIKNFSNPTYSGKANGNVDLRIADGIFKFPFIEKIIGKLKINASFLVKQSKKEVIVQECSGAIQLSNVQLKLEDDKRTFDQINGRISLQGSQIGIESTNLKVEKTDFNIAGTFDNVFNYINGSGKLDAKVNLISNITNVADLGTTSKSQKIEGDRIFALPDNIMGHIDLQLAQLTYENHRFNNVSGRMLIEGRRLNFPQLSCANAGAALRGSLEICERTPEVFYLKASVLSKNILFKPLFKEWNNFQQSVITDQNLSGNAEASLDFQAPFDLRSGVMLNEIQSSLSLKVYNGHLKNVESFKDIVSSLRTKSGKLVLGNNNINEFEKKLNDLSFETLENTINISNGVVQIPKMKIVSSAMEMDVSGTHSFDNLVDYRFAFRLRDIKQQNKNTEFGEIIDDETGFRVYMRMYGPLENPKIEWDKSAKFEQTQLNILAAKQEAKSILKAEFGFFKKDSTINSYVPKEAPKEDVKINFNPKIVRDNKSVSPPVKDEKPNKDPKIKKNLQKWKGQQDEDNEDVIVVGKSKGK
jgi:hypothetical protein